MRCSCGNKINKAYVYYDESRAFGCKDCVTYKRGTTGICPHCKGEIDEFTRVYYKNDKVVGCDECVCYIEPRSGVWDRDEDEEYI